MKFYVKLIKIKCERCGKVWQPRNPKDVRICPYCKSARFDQPRQKKVKDADKISD
jgi:Zn finger protein HypA/HybF involved in hydrogenase expression